MKSIKEIDDALNIISTARNRWDYEEKQGQLWEAVRKYPKEAIDYFYNYPEYQFSIAWCLAHLKSKIIKDFFVQEASNKDQYIRWCAYINISKYKSEDMIEIFAKGLRDRSSLVKGEALEAVKGIKDQRIMKELNHLVTLKSFKNNCPGYFEQANKLLDEFNGF
jgi:hypothetical protein